MCFNFIFNFSLNISNSKKNSARYDQKFMLVFTCIIHCPCQSLIKREFSRRSFEKSTNIKFNENPSVGCGVVPCRKDRSTDGQKKGQADMVQLTAAFRNFTRTLKNNCDRLPLIFEIYRIHWKRKMVAAATADLLTCVLTWFWITVYDKTISNILFCYRNMKRSINVRRRRERKVEDKKRRLIIIIIIIIIIIFINCNWVITRWQWLYYMYTNMERKKK